MNQRTLAIMNTVGLTICGYLELTDPATLGLPPQIEAWAGLVAAALGALNSVLKPIQSGGGDREG